MIGETDPDEMEDLVNQDAFEFAALCKKPGIEQDPPMRNVGRCEMGSERLPQLDADGRAGKSR